MFCALVMTKMNSILLVLLVTSCCCWLPVGSDEVLRQTNNSNSNGDDDGMSQQKRPTADVLLAEVNNYVVSSTTESQGASSVSEANRTQPTSSSGTKDNAYKSNDGGDVNPKKIKQSDKSKDVSLPSLSTSLLSTTARSVRNGATSGRSSASRDTKLMSLLAARRSALQRNQWRSHRRSSTTNRTSIDSLSSASSLAASKNSSDPRSSCERNCTKNFTRRTTASCIRRCLALYKATNSTLSAAVRTKVDEKDNNEILETDESSHGFFVIAKDINGTANHIGDGVKSSESSTEKVSRTGIRPFDSIEIPPYIYFGQKLPPLRPNRKGNQTVESSSKTPVEKSKSWTRGHQSRNFGSYNRFHSSRNVIRPTTTPVAIKPTLDTSGEQLTQEVYEEDTSRVSEYILKRESVGSNATETILLGTSTDKAEETTTEAKTEPVTNITTATLTTTSTTTTTTTTTTPTTTTSTTASTYPTATTKESVSTTTSTTTTQNDSSSTTSKSSSQPSTSETPATLESTFSKIQLTEPNILETSSTLALTTLQMTNPETKPTQETLPPPPPEELTNMFEHVDEDKPNLIIFYNVTTQLPTPSSPNVFTRTTISSSIRSTVNPKVKPEPNLLPIAEYNLSSRSFETTTLSIDSMQTSTENYKDSTQSVQDITGVTMVTGDVTIEMKKINTATYVLAGLGVFPIIVIVLYVVKTIVFKRRYKDDDDLDQFTSDGKPISPVRQMDHHDDDECSDQYSIATERDFDRKNLRFKSLLGEGNFGQVWKAEADDLVGHMGTTRIVAVKTVRSGSTQVSLNDEADIMKKLGSHPNVVTLLGACLESEPHLLIMEYAMRGRLLSLLRAARSATNMLPASVPGGRSLAPLSPRTLAGFALDIARGMEYIADKKIVHRDLAARNVLLDHNGVCKICDFGMSIDLELDRHSPVQSKKSDSLQQTQCFDTRFHFDFGSRWMSHWSQNNNNSHDKKQNHDSVSKRPALPIRWMAPEALQYHIFSIKTDVWAFGIVLWEVATLGCTPYPNLSGREVIRNVPNGARPELPQDGRPEFYDLMQRCWRKDPQTRPSFREARIEISRISCKWHDDDLATSDYMDVSGFSEDLEHGMVYFNRRISEFECEI